jgi:hypothetical protein
MKLPRRNERLPPVSISIPLLARSVNGSSHASQRILYEYSNVMGLAREIMGQVKRPAETAVHTCKATENTLILVNMGVEMSPALDSDHGIHREGRRLLVEIECQGKFDGAGLHPILVVGDVGAFLFTPFRSRYVC